jgi:hypothetical protein
VTTEVWRAGDSVERIGNLTRTVVPLPTVDDTWMEPL